MSERKNLTIIELKEIEKVGDKQIPKLSFKATDGDGEHWYHTFRTSLFEAIIKGQTINADIETSTREYGDNKYTDRRITQIYLDGQPLGGKKQQPYYRGKSPEELTLSARSYALAYAKDLAVAQVISLKEVLVVADDFVEWLKESMEETPKSKAQAAKSKPEPVEAPEVPVASSPVPQSESYIDMDWLKESLKTLQGNPETAKGWRNTDVILYLNSMTGAKAKTVIEALKPLTREQAEDFTNQIQKALDSIER